MSSATTNTEAFELGWVAGHNGLVASPNEAEAALKAAGFEADNRNVNLFLNGNDDGVAGDTWRLDAATERKLTEQLELQ